MGVPTWMYRTLSNGDKEAQIFDSDDLPKASDGWKDAPESEDIDLASMTKDQLEAFAKDRFGVDLDKRKKASGLREEVLGLLTEPG